MSFYIRNPFDSGNGGALIVGDTSAHGGNFYAIQVIADAVFTTIVGNVTGYASVTIPAGTVIYGGISSFTLQSGKVIAYST